VVQRQAANGGFAAKVFLLLLSCIMTSSPLAKKKRLHLLENFLYNIIE
jgi:hypothetical protein